MQVVFMIMLYIVKETIILYQIEAEFILFYMILNYYFASFLTFEIISEVIQNIYLNIILSVIFL